MSTTFLGLLCRVQACSNYLKKILPADPNEYGVNPKYYAN